MSQYFLDSSALIKRYSPEPGSDWIKQLAYPASDHLIFLAEITLAEVSAAFASKHRRSGGISIQQRDRLLTLFLGHCVSQYRLLPIKRSIIDLAVSLTQRHRLRGYDAVQLAAALNASQTLADAGLSPLTFVAADKDLLSAAQSEGLSVENPNER